MKKKITILTAVFVLAFALNSFAGFYFDDNAFGDATTDQQYMIDQSDNTSNNVAAYWDTLPQAFGEEAAPDADAILDAAIKVGPNPTYSGMINNS